MDRGDNSLNVRHIGNGLLVLVDDPMVIATFQKVQGNRFAGYYYSGIFT